MLLQLSLAKRFRCYFGGGMCYSNCPGLNVSVVILEVVYVTPTVLVPLPKSTMRCDFATRFTSHTSLENIFVMHV